MNKKNNLAIIMTGLLVFTINNIHAEQRFTKPAKTENPTNKSKSYELKKTEQKFTKPTKTENLTNKPKSNEFRKLAKTENLTNKPKSDESKENDEIDEIEEQNNKIKLIKKLVIGVLLSFPFLYRYSVSFCRLFYTPRQEQIINALNKKFSNLSLKKEISQKEKEEEEKIEKWAENNPEDFIFVSAVWLSSFAYGKKLQKSILDVLTDKDKNTPTVQNMNQFLLKNLEFAAEKLKQKQLEKYDKVFISILVRYLES
jgi:hypothetical protein